MMAGSASHTETDSFGNRNLWQFISGTGSLRPKELIKRELTRNQNKLLNGVLFYKKPTSPQGSVLKTKKLSKQQSEFVQKLSTFLGLDEGQSYDLYFSYISKDFRGSQKNLQVSLSTDRHSQVLLFKVRDYYFSERLYLLQTIRHILTYWGETENHPYQEEYDGFVKLLNELTNNDFIKKLLAQLDSVCDGNLPSWETHGNLMNERQTMFWAHQNLKEQHELLEILLVYLKDFLISGDDFNRLLEKFKRQGFGRRQLYKHILDDSMDRMLKRIGSLEVLVLLQALDLETLERLSHTGNFEEHSLLSDKRTFQSVDKMMGLLGSEPPHGPILLSWAVVRQLYLGSSGGNVTRKMGNLSLQLGVFDFMLEMLKREPLCGKTVTASLSHIVVYTVLLAALTAFDESTLTRSATEMQTLYDITSNVLERESIAENVWTRGLDQGLGNLFQTAQLNFPLDFSTLVKISTSLASATESSASKVLELWSELPRYTEYLDRNHEQDLRTTADPSVWQLVRDKMPYPKGDFRIPAGVFGQQISGGSKPVLDMEIPIIQWEVRYDGWQLLKCEIEDLLYQVSGGAGMVSPVQIERVTEITEFVKAICVSQPQAIDGLADIISLFYTLIQRFSAFVPPPLDLLAACVECITCVAKLHPKQAWHEMKQTGLLPFLTENIDNMAEVTSGQGLSRGLYGAILAGYENPQGRYPLTSAYLDFTAQMVLPLYKLHMENELLAAMMYLLREILPVFQKWRYYNWARKEVIGHKCLSIAHKILNLRGVKERKRPGRPHLQDVCVHSLLFSEAGRALLEIIATGVDTVEMLLSQQSSQSEGAGEDLVQLIQIGFSVMNRLLLLRSHDQGMSPVEVALTSQPAGYQNQHIVGVIAEYIYHRTNPQLPRLATLFLRRLAVVLPMSILACLGNQAEPIRDIYLMRLHSTTEDLGLKTGILELLSDCVDTQPGLIEIFLNVQTSQTLQSGNSKDLSVGKTSCLQTVLDLMDVQKQSTYQCPPDLLCACTNFIQALWAGLRETAMEALRAKENFWPSLLQPLFKDLADPDDDQMLSFRLRTVSNILKILAQEIYTTSGNKLDNNLKKILKDLTGKGRIKYWSAYITNCINSAELESHDMSHDSVLDVLDHPTHKLLVAWKNFLVVIAKINISELKLEDGIKELIIVDLLDAIHSQHVLWLVDTRPDISKDYKFTGSLNELTHKLSQTCSALYITLIHSWKSSIKVWSQVLQTTLETLCLTMSSGDMVIPSVQIGLLGTMTTLLQHRRLDTNKRVEMPKLASMLNSVSEMLLQSSRELPLPSELKQKQQQQQEVGDKSFYSTDHRLKLQTVTCCCMEELLQHIIDADIWLPILQENMILTALLSSAEMYLKAQEGLHYVQPLFILFLTIAKADKGAEALALAGLTPSVCLAITYCYQGSEVIPQGPVPNTTKAAPSTSSSVTWHGVYCLCLELYSNLLQTLKYSFLEDAFNFVGSHQDRLQQCLDIARLGLHIEAFKEVEKTCSFVCQLSHFSREWRLHLPDSLNNILTSMMFMCQTFVGYLIRPRYLQHTLEHWTDKKSSKHGQDSLLLRTLSHQSSTEDMDNPTPQNIAVQLSMLKALGHSFIALRQFSPDLIQILMDTNMDVGEYEPFLALGFSAPPVDQDTPPTFGCMLSCVTVCMRLLSKIEPKSVSPQKGDQTPAASGETTLVQSVPKSLVLFVMENALYLIMSQGMLYLKDPAVHNRDKQLLKRELGTEMNSILSSIHRYFRRGGPQSPATATQPSPRTQKSPAGATLSRSISQTFVSNHEQAIYRLVQEFSKQVLR